MKKKKRQKRQQKKEEKSGGASRGRVSYQRGIPRLVFFSIRQAKICYSVPPGHLGKQVKILSFFMFLFHTITLL